MKLSTLMSSDKKQKKDNLLSTKTTLVKMIIMAMLSAIAVVLMLFDFPLWFAPPFYKLDFSEVPVLIGAFALGPVAGIIIEFLKILLNFAINFTDTAGVGEMANFIIGCSMVVPAAIVYHKNKTLKSAISGLILGTITMAILGGFMNAYVLIPAYSYFFKLPIDSIIAMGTKVNPSITNIKTLIFYAVTPFNLFKGTLISVITLALYKRLSKVIKSVIGM